MKPAAPALAAALLFGASTPVAKLLVGDIAPLLLAGLLYLGSGLGLGGVLVARRLTGRGANASMRWTFARMDWPWLGAAILFGGVLGPALLMAGLSTTDAASASLLLNVEGVLTAALAWWVFKENADRGVVVGMLAIVAGGVLLSWEPGGLSFSPGALLVIAACACWAVDNNLTRKVSTNDAVLIACVKGLTAGLVNAALALGTGASLPPPTVVATVGVVGFLGYGVSLALFVVGLRTLGAARTGAYFSIAPLFGVVLSLALWPQVPGPTFWGAALLMAAGLWMHLRERHEHVHTHEALEHSHPHRHDLHHQHSHPAGVSPDEPHVHWHRHERLMHKHPHYPDIHHRHEHQAGISDF
jgi:drug/metabolite transporter (DMT)-like permease